MERAWDKFKYGNFGGKQEGRSGQVVVVLSVGWMLIFVSHKLQILLICQQEHEVMGGVDLRAWMLHTVVLHHLMMHKATTM